MLVTLIHKMTHKVLTIFWPRSLSFGKVISDQFFDLCDSTVVDPWSDPPDSESTKWSKWSTWFNLIHRVIHLIKHCQGHWLYQVLDQSDSLVNLSKCKQLSKTKVFFFFSVLWQKSNLKHRTMNASFDNHNKLLFLNTIKKKCYSVKVFAVVAFWKQKLFNNWKQLTLGSRKSKSFFLFLSFWKSAKMLFPFNFFVVWNKKANRLIRRNNVGHWFQIDFDHLLFFGWNTKCFFFSVWSKCCINNSTTVFLCLNQGFRTPPGQLFQNALRAPRDLHDPQDSHDLGNLRDPHHLKTWVTFLTLLPVKRHGED